MFHILEVCFGESVTEYITNRLDRTKDMSLDVVSLYVLRQMIKVGISHELSVSAHELSVAGDGHYHIDIIC